MLAFVAAVIFLSLQGAVSHNRECLRKGSSVCEEFFEGIRDEIPQTKEQMDFVCKRIISFLSCTVDAFEECGDDETEKGNFYRHLLSYTETELCNKESTIYQDLSNNLPCIRETTSKMHRVCASIDNEETMREISRPLEDYIQEISEIEGKGKVDDCLFDMYWVACESMTIGDACGEPAGHAVEDALLNLDYSIKNCPADLLLKMPLLKNTLRAIAEAEEEVENTLRRRK